MSDPAAPVSAFLAAAHAELDKLETEAEALIAPAEKFAAVALADLEAVVKHAEADVIGKATVTWDALKALIAKAKAAV